jgi:hypothetical protein
MSTGEVNAFTIVGFLTMSKSSGRSWFRNSLINIVADSQTLVNPAALEHFQQSVFVRVVAYLHLFWLRVLESYRKAAKLF